MQENIKEWFRPGSVGEVLEIIQNGQGIPYAGGTGLSKGQVTGLIDLRRLNLNYIRETEAGTAIGACAKFNDIARFQWSDGRRILGKALSRAASNTLRNLITLGGSLAFRPVWSNVPTPLLALNAIIKVIGLPASEYPIADFLKLKRGGKFLITEVVIPPASGYGVYYRFSRTRFDYSALDLAVYIEIESDVIKLARLAVGNVVATASRLTQVEDRLIGLQISDPQVNKILSAVEIRSVRNPNFSREFLLNLLRTELERAFALIREQNDAS